MQGDESPSLSRPPRNQKRSPGRRHPEAKEELGGNMRLSQQGAGRGQLCSDLPSGSEADRDEAQADRRPELTLGCSVRALVWSAVRYNQPGSQLMETQSQEVRIPHPTHNLLWGRAVDIFSLSLLLFICVCAFMSSANAHLCRVLRGDSLDLPIQASLFWQKPLEWKGQPCHRREHGAAMNSWRAKIP